MHTNKKTFACYFLINLRILPGEFLQSFRPSTQRECLKPPAPFLRPSLDNNFFLRKEFDRMLFDIRLDPFAVYVVQDFHSFAITAQDELQNHLVHQLRQPIMQQIQAII